MLLISPYTRLSHKIDTLKSLTDSLYNCLQDQFVCIDSIHSSTQHVTDNQSVMSSQLDSIYYQLQTISDNGVGYSDVAAHIAIPLIIALFAFAFPFLFTVISHINNKYESEDITGLFSSETSYKWFLRGAGISAGYLVLIGILSLCLGEVAHNLIMHVLNWTSVFVAGGYSLIIICFVLTCLEYNSPQKILQNVGEQFKKKALQAEARDKRLKKQEADNNQKKPDGKQRFRATGIGINRIYAFSEAESLRLNNSVALCSYAIKKHDNKLFQSVITSVSQHQHPDKKQAYHDLLFYEDVLETYLFGPENEKIFDTLLWHWFMTFNKSQLPNLGNILRMFVKIVQGVRQGRTSLLEQYLVRSRYGYHYITDVPTVAYVCGYDIGTQKKVSEERIRVWHDLVDMHYLAMAHLFALGHTEIIKIMMSGDNLGYDRLLPGTGIEVLRCYARCKENHFIDGHSHYWFADEIIGANPDIDMLEKFTAVLLLLAPTESYEELGLISEKHLQIIRDGKKKILFYGNIWKENKVLSGLYPQVTAVDLEEYYRNYTSFFERASSPMTEIKEEKNDLLSKIIAGLLNALRKPCHMEGREDIYIQEISEVVKEKINYGFWSILYGNQGNILDGLVGDDSKRKTETVIMGDYTYLIYKLPLVKKKDFDNPEISWDLSRVFNSRYLFMVYGAIANMQITDKTIPIDTFDAFFASYVGDSGQDYVIIDSESQMDVYYEFDKPVKERRSLFYRTYKGAEYKHYDFQIGWYLKDLEELEPFNNTLVIIKREDLPFVFSTEESNEPTVNIQDESEKEKGSAVVRITVNPNLAAKFNKNAQVLRLKLQRLTR